MPAKPDTSSYKTFGQITDRLDQIVDAVRDKDTSLERSLDLFDEAIALGSKAVGLVDSTEFTPEERSQLEAKAAEEAAEAEKDAATEAAGGAAGAASGAQGDDVAPGERDV